MALNKEAWWNMMTAKYGSEDAVREAMRIYRAKAKPSTKGGFAYLKATGQEDRLKEISAKGGRGGKKDDLTAEEIS